ncbi:MAG: DUF1499 domain-containing protein [Beijerinckiaceae bacterium]
MKPVTWDEPVSAAARWSLRFALFSMALSVIAILIIRTRAADVASGVSVFGFAILAACAAVLLAVAASVSVWQTGRRGMGLAVLGVLLAALVLAWPMWLAVQAVRLPILNDVSTDINNPPGFSRSTRALEARGGHAPSELPAEARLPQTRAYPNVQPIVIDLDGDEAFQLVLAAAKAMGWQVIESSAPGGRMGDGRIEAIDRTLIMRFPDDITIRVRPGAGQSRIDVRSASRYGRHDFGVNARRIERFARQLQELLDAR